ncbi:interferon-induced protein with tetratricopeptide repeats 5-like isoform X1 [Varanus komodoensis]|uniref:Interferon-induced protein with tetratricopeptide repeats 5 n=2 Tax=Varanus komodoensis TaxID=61221 RepID=A0A8D2IZ84_VARKO|nr:interferon-induced protein with tetratricopeptide repeats 5-like isoform X1 [Varanus komodoensis]
MSDISKDSLEKILTQLECHFTWMLLKDDVDPDELEERILEQICFLQSRSKVRNYNLLAYVKYLNGKREEALESLQKAKEAAEEEYPGDIEKNSLVTWGNYAWLYCHMDRLPEAETYVKRVESVCKQHQSDSPYKMTLPEIYCEKGWAFLKFGKKYYEKAKESFEKALQEEPENPECNAGYAITVYRLEEYHERRSAAAGSSLEPLKRAVTLNPDNAFVLPLLALKLQETHKAKEGEKYIEEALSKHPYDPYVLRYAAKFYRRKGNVEKPLLCLTKALELTPNSGFLHHQMGLCYRAQYFKMKKAKARHQVIKENKLLELSIFHFQKVVERKTKFISAYLDLAGMYAEAGQLRTAEETYRKVLVMSRLTCAEKQEIHFRFGHFQEFYKKSELEALKHYLEGLKIENNSFERNKCKHNLDRLIDKRTKKGLVDALSLGGLALICQLNGFKEDAIKFYELALKRDPGNEEFLSAIFNLKLSLQS